MSKSEQRAPERCGAGQPAPEQGRPQRYVAGGSDGAAPPVVAEILRGRAPGVDVLVESRIRGTVVGLDPTGAVLLAAGDPSAVISPRSTVKPMQAVGMLTAGLDVVFGATPVGPAVPGVSGGGSAAAGGIPPELLAIVASSHSGEPEQVAAVRAVLAAAGRGPSDLACPPDLPLGHLAHERHLAAGGGPERLLMNCSGKHAGMIACCAGSGWPVSGYLEPDHPLQLRIRAAIEELVGGPVTAPAVDGCGAPLFGVPLLGLVRGMRELALAAAGPAGPAGPAGAGPAGVGPVGTASPRQRVAAAMRAFPARVGGPGRPDTELMLAVPSLIAKDGAEGVSVAATSAGFAAAVKIEDGSQRAAMPVLIAALRYLGAFGADPDADLARVEELGTPKTFGGGAEVGVLRVVLSPGT
ncbi:L-asparaginase II [Parafrankia irregularis]|uniref:L-asparaginase II n=1 Tax=Parafrankia irregularis TaxID=795642 RepID=A0A0S4QX12_9ACTN|nr:L-asparaginase II [Parafrankia irregularis]